MIGLDPLEMLARDEEIHHRARAADKTPLVDLSGVPQPQHFNCACSNVVTEDECPGGCGRPTNNASGEPCDECRTAALNL